MSVRFSGLTPIRVPPRLCEGPPSQALEGARGCALAEAVAEERPGLFEHGGESDREGHSAGRSPIDDLGVDLTAGAVDPDLKVRQGLHSLRGSDVGLCLRETDEPTLLSGEWGQVSYCYISRERGQLSY